MIEGKKVSRLHCLAASSSFSRQVCERLSVARSQGEGQKTLSSGRQLNQRASLGLSPSCVNMPNARNRERSVRFGVYERVEGHDGENKSRAAG